MVQLGFERRPARLPTRGPLVGAGLTIGRDCEKKTSFPLGPRFCLETPHRTRRCLAATTVTANSTHQLGVSAACKWLPR